MGKRGPKPGSGLRRQAKRYASVHLKVKKLRGPARLYVCSSCPRQADHWAYDHTDPEPQIEWVPSSGQYGAYLEWSPDLDRYMPMCGLCHRWFDKLDQMPSECSMDDCTRVVAYEVGLCGGCYELRWRFPRQQN